MTIDLAKTINGVNADGPPHIDFIKRVANGDRLGVFASSFNPPTTAHVGLIQRAAETFSLDEVLALAGKSNADKLDYACSLEDRLAMLTLTFATDSRVSIGLSSHAFYVDMIDALYEAYPAQTDLHFIVGFDTFERVLDVQDRYTKRYYREFGSRLEVLGCLFERSSFIVAGRAGAGSQSVRELVVPEPAVPSNRVLYLDFPPDLGELSSTEVRTRRREGRPITGFVPVPVEEYISQHGLYRA